MCITNKSCAWWCGQPKKVLCMMLCTTKKRCVQWYICVVKKVVCSDVCNQKIVNNIVPNQKKLCVTMCISKNVVCNNNVIKKVCAWIVMSNQKKKLCLMICITKKVVGNDVCDQNRMRTTLPPTKKVVHNQNKFCVTMCIAKKVVRNGLCNQKNCEYYCTKPEKSCA